MSQPANGTQRLQLDAMANALEASGEFRVLRRLARRSLVERYDGSATRLGVFVDVETTGLDPIRDEIIELAMVPFIYGIDGRIFEIREPFESLREPNRAISPAITALTGITNEAVAGQAIDLGQITAIAESADLVVAHNAAFDRRFVERLSGRQNLGRAQCLRLIGSTKATREPSSLISQWVPAFSMTGIELRMTASLPSSFSHRPCPRAESRRWGVCWNRLVDRRGVSGLKMLRSN
jgi:hypothetical protein